MRDGADDLAGRTCGAGAGADHHGKSKLFFSGSGSPRDRSFERTVRYRIFSNGSAPDEFGRVLPCSRMRDDFRILHGWRTRLGAGMPSADCFTQCDFWTSRSRSWIDYRLGWNPAAPAAGGEKHRAPNVCGGRADHCEPCAASWISGRDRRGSGAILRARIASTDH